MLIKVVRSFVGKTTFLADEGVSSPLFYLVRWAILSISAVGSAKRSPR